MPDAVLEMFSASGSLVLSHRARQTVFRAKGRHSVTTGSSPSPTGTRSVLTVSCSPAGVVALRPVTENISCAVYVTSYSDGQRRFNIMCEGDASQQIDWWLFDAPDPYDPGGNVRFELYTKGGELAWRLYTRPMKVVGAFLADSTGIASAQSLDVPAGSTYAIAPGNPSGRRQDVPSGAIDGNTFRGRSFWDAASWTGAQVRMQSRLLDLETVSHTGERPTVIYSPRNALVVDVTNL